MKIKTQCISVSANGTKAQIVFKHFNEKTGKCLFSETRHLHKRGENWYGYSAAYPAFLRRVEDSYTQYPPTIIEGDTYEPPTEEIRTAIARGEAYLKRKKKIGQPAQAYAA